MSLTRQKIDKSAVLHIPLSQYAFAVDENSLVIRIRVKKDNLSTCILHVADRVCRATPICFDAFVMEKFAKDEYFDYYQATITLPYNRVCYYFELKQEEEWTYYYADRFTKELADQYKGDKIIDGRSEYYQYPFILRTEIPDLPDWFKDSCVYNIFPDSFASKNRSISKNKKIITLENGVEIQNCLGGTISGIRENLDYIKNLGFDCLYLNPIFTAGEYHKYDVIDYYHIDPCLGDEDDFMSLVEEVHSKGMHIIIDGVFNHCSWRFFAFEDVVDNGENSMYKDWFYDVTFPVTRPISPQEVPGYTCFAYERKMPKLNTANTEVQRYFSAVGAYWINKFHVDGWRLDVANEISREFWQKFRKSVKAANPGAVLIGEVWENAETWIPELFDSTMNYEFRRICVDYLSSEVANATKAAYAFENMRIRYPENIVKGQLNLLDSHDVPRFLSMCNGDMELLKLGCILLILMPGVPSLFYGDECGVQGISEDEYRRAMPWDKEEGISNFLKKVIEIRKRMVDKDSIYYPVWDKIKEVLFVFARENNKSIVEIAINAGAKTVEFKTEKNSKILFASEENTESNIAAKGFLIQAIEK
ncbi:MAG TPA: glycoside hydrolase family 13 protein [Lachnospiraceae bacterium]